MEKFRKGVQKVFSFHEYFWSVFLSIYINGADTYVIRWPLDTPLAPYTYLIRSNHS